MYLYICIHFSLSLSLSLYLSVFVCRSAPPVLPGGLPSPSAILAPQLWRLKAACLPQALLSWIILEPSNTQTPGRMQKVDPPWGSIIYTKGVRESTNWEIYFSDPFGGLGVCNKLCEKTFSISWAMARGIQLFGVTAALSTERAPARFKFCPESGSFAGLQGATHWALLGTMRG